MTLVKLTVVLDQHKLRKMQQVADFQETSLDHELDRAIEMYLRVWELPNDCLTDTDPRKH